MKDGFIKVAAATPTIRVADCEYNGRQIRDLIEEADSLSIRVLVLPELCLTGYTCGELFLQDTLLDGARTELRHIIDFTKGKRIFVTLGLPLLVYGKLYNVAAAIYDGKLLGFVPKMNLPGYSEFYEGRHFNPGTERLIETDFYGEKVPFGTNQLFRCADFNGLTIGIEICEDLWVPV